MGAWANAGAEQSRDSRSTAMPLENLLHASVLHCRFSWTTHASAAAPDATVRAATEPLAFDFLNDVLTDLISWSGQFHLELQIYLADLIY